MPAAGIFVTFIGYWVSYYGLTQIQGGNWGLLDLGLPTRWKMQTVLIPKDGQAAGNAKNAKLDPNRPGYANGQAIP